jgi:acetylornithine deacetylase/succinyl-diaminopimelate desuccinylase-like protein
MICCHHLTSRDVTLQHLPVGLRTLALGTLLALASSAVLAAPDLANRRLAHDIFKELIEINTTESVGSTTEAAQAMRKRLLDAGFPSPDITIAGANDRNGNLVVRYRGKPGGHKRPILIICHLDVVEARREDWTTDPFKLVEQDGYFYGRGTGDMKDSDAIVVANFIRLRREGFLPDRDLILALTTGEEGGSYNGVDWLLKTHRDWIDAEFALNPDGGGLKTDRGKPLYLGIEASEKLYADYQVLATGPGGHSSLPTAENPIYRVADALAILEKSPFPAELNPISSAFFAQAAGTRPPDVAADMKAILATPPDPAAIARLSRDPTYNAMLRTTCVATMISGGHAVNALPQRGEANVNCRILPGHSQEEVRLELVRLFNDPGLTVRYRSDANQLFDHGSDRSAMKPPPLRPDVMAALGKATTALWPGTPIIPTMETGASDSIYTMMADIPSYGISGVGIDQDDDRSHGKDERIRISAFDDGLEFYYQLLKALTGGKR